jgi:hypothetical protein
MTLLSYTRFITIPFSVAIGAGNYWLWIELQDVIGNWSLLGLFLTFYGIVPAIFLFVFLESVIGKRLKKSSSNPTGVHHAIDVMAIIQAYGKTLETDAPATGCVADESKLPYTKDTIKKAIIAGLKSTDNDQMKEHLKIGYISLSNWQEGVGEKDQGIDISKIERNQSAEDIIRAMESAEQALDGKDWNKIILGEQETLMQELKSLGF